MTMHSGEARLREALAELASIESPWRVEGVDIDPAAMTATVHVAYPHLTAMACPQCGAAIATRHDTVTRRLRDKDCFDYRTFLSVAVPRVKCPTHGTQRIKVPWASRERVQTTLRFETEALALLKECSVHAAATQLRITDRQLGRRECQNLRV